MATRVAIITDCDVPEFEKINDNLIPRDAAEIARDFRENETLRQTMYDADNSHVFIAPHWTMEYSMLQSETLRNVVLNKLRHIHSQFDIENPEVQMATKLLSKSLKKTEFAYEMASWF